jgi:hypothetical protein
MNTGSWLENLKGRLWDSQRKCILHYFEQKKTVPMVRFLAVVSLDLDYSVVIIFHQGYCVNRGCLALEHQPVLLVTLWRCVVPMDHF